MAKANGGTLSGGARVTKVIAHGTVGGASSAAQGGRFKDGFLSAGVTQALAPGIGKPDSGQLGFSVEGTLAAAVVGGTASVVGGGKFANGAVTGAFAYAFSPQPGPGDGLSDEELLMLADSGQIQSDVVYGGDPTGLLGLGAGGAARSLAVRAFGYVARPFARLFGIQRSGVVFGTNPTSGLSHATRHLSRAGLSAERVQARIGSDLIGRTVGQGSSGYTGSFRMQGVRVQYRAEVVPGGPLQGRINVGQIKVFP